MTKLHKQQRAEAEILIDRISTDEDALRAFVYTAINIRAALDSFVSAMELSDNGMNDSEHITALYAAREQAQEAIKETT